MNKRTIADVGMAYKWRIAQGNSTKGSNSLTQCRRRIRVVARRADIKQAARTTTVSTANQVMVQILFWRTEWRTRVATVEGVRRCGGTDWPVPGVTEGNSRSEQNKEDSEETRHFHLLSPCRSGGQGG